MPDRDDLREAADALGGSVVVCGLGAYADRLAGVTFRDARYAAVSALLAEASDGSAGRPDPAAVVVALDPATVAEEAETLRALPSVEATRRVFLGTPALP